MLPVRGRGSVLAVFNALCTSGLWMTSCLPIAGQTKATPLGRLLRVTRQGAAHDRGRSLMCTVALLRYIITQNEGQLCTESDAAARSPPCTGCARHIMGR